MQFPSISYADLWILASYAAIESMGGARAICNHPSHPRHFAVFSRAILGAIRPFFRLS